MNPIFVDPQAIAQSVASVSHLISSSPKTSLSSLLHERATSFKPGDTSTYLVPKIDFEATEEASTIRVPPLIVTEGSASQCWAWPSDLDQHVLDQLEKEHDKDPNVFSKETSATEAINSALGSVIKKYPAELSKKTGTMRSEFRRRFGQDRHYTLTGNTTIIFGDFPKGTQR